VPKVYITAREIAEIDPYLPVTCFPAGITEDNCDVFLMGGSPLDIVIEECDSIDIKILVRYRSRRHRIPVVMGPRLDRCRAIRPRATAPHFQRDMDIEEVLSTPRSSWQRAYVEWVIGSIRRECLDHLIVFNEASLRRALRSYFGYYHKSRTHLWLGKDSPEPRPIQPVEMGRVVAVTQVGGLHHRYERRAA